MGLSGCLPLFFALATNIQFYSGRDLIFKAIQPELTDGKYHHLGIEYSI